MYLPPPNIPMGLGIFGGGSCLYFGIFGGGRVFALGVILSTSAKKAHFSFHGTVTSPAFGGKNVTDQLNKPDQLLITYYLYKL